MNGSRDEGRCYECDGTHGSHYPGCTFEGEEGKGRVGGSDVGKFCFFWIFMFGVFIAALCPPIGVGIIILGAKITNV